MPRWEPQARDRLRDAALELFLAHGYDNVTVAQITERAGLTRRTFSRYFTDKRDVLFADSEQLPAVLAAAVGRADQDLPPFAALLTALAEVGSLVPDRARSRAPRHRRGQPGAPGAGADQVRRRYQRAGGGARAAGGRAGDRRPPRAGRHRHLPYRVRPLGAAPGTREPGRRHPPDGGRARRQPGARRPAGQHRGRPGDLTAPAAGAGDEESAKVARSGRIARRCGPGRGRRWRSARRPGRRRWRCPRLRRTAGASPSSSRTR